MSQTVGVVVPAYRPDVPQLRRYVTAVVEGLDPERVVVELDAPKDGVPAQLADLPAGIERVPYRRGKGAAVTAGFEQLDTDVLVFADADGSTPVASLEAVVDRVAAGDADLSVGSRRHPDADVTSHQTFARRFLGDGFAWLAGRLLTVSLYDYQCGAKAIDADGWERVVETPIRWEDQPGSTVSPVTDSVALFKALLTARHRAKQLSDDRLHTAIAARRESPTALVERER